MTYDIVSERNGPDQILRNPDDSYELLKRYSGKRQEHFLVLTLRGDNSVSRVKIITVGLANRTLVAPREVFHIAIAENATGILIAHNHPSGSLDASDDDREVTRRLVKAGEILGIPVLDHIIFGRTGFMSFVERGLMPVGGGRL